MQEDPIKNDKPATEAASFALYPDDRATIEAVAVRNGSSASQALRFIIRDWARQNLPPQQLRKTT